MSFTTTKRIKKSNLLQIHKQQHNLSACHYGTFIISSFMQADLVCITSWAPCDAHPPLPPTTIPIYQVFSSHSIILPPQKKNRNKNKIIIIIIKIMDWCPAGNSLVSWGEGTSLALVGNPSGDGVLIKILVWRHLKVNPQLLWVNCLVMR